MITTEVISSFTGEYRFLSNFWPCEITFRGQKLPSVEHAYVAAKCDISDPDQLKSIAAMTAGGAKRYGRVTPIRPMWDSMKFSYMFEFVGQKFHRNQELADKLIATGDALLIEGNDWGDRYWGQCPVGQGENYLGKILMNVRDELNRI